MPPTVSDDMEVEDTEFDCGTFGRAPVEVCRERDDVVAFEEEDVVDVLLAGGSKDVTVVDGAVGTLLLLRKCLKEKEEFCVGGGCCWTLCVGVGFIQPLELLASAADAVVLKLLSFMPTGPKVALIFV